MFQVSLFYFRVLKYIFTNFEIFMQLSLCFSFHLSKGHFNVLLWAIPRHKLIEPGGQACPGSVVCLKSPHVLDGSFHTIISTQSRLLLRRRAHTHTHTHTHTYISLSSQSYRIFSRSFLFLTSPANLTGGPIFEVWVEGNPHTSQIGLFAQYFLQ